MKQQHYRPDSIRLPAETRFLVQPYVMKYVVDTLFEAPEDEDPIELTEEDIGFLFLLFKTVIDVLDQAS